MDAATFFSELPSTGEIAPVPKGRKVDKDNSFNDMRDYCQGDCSDCACNCEGDC